MVNSFFFSPSSSSSSSLVQWTHSHVHYFRFLAHIHIVHRVVPKSDDGEEEVVLCRLSVSLSIASWYINDNDHADCDCSSYLILEQLNLELHCSIAHMFYPFIYFLFYLVISQTFSSSILFTLDHVKYSLSDRVLTIPKLGVLRGVQIDYEHPSYEKYHLINVEAFLGIQYGLYQGRFEPSKERFELHPTSQIHKQINFGPACAQQIWTNQSELQRIRSEYFAKEYYPNLLKYLSEQNEDECLYMNIYQPLMKDSKGRVTD